MGRPTMLFAVLVAAGVMLLGGAGAEPVEAQTCEGSCEDCVGGGHAFGEAGYAAMGREYHNCPTGGGGTSCADSNHTCCESDPEDCPEGTGGGASDEDFAAANPNAWTRWIDQERLYTSYDKLRGGEIQEILARSEGRFFINWTRRSLQRVGCDRPLVVANLPLSNPQLRELQDILALPQKGAVPSQ